MSFTPPLNVEQSATKLRQLMKDKGLDAFWITSFDPFLSEYTPPCECHRLWFTGFTGSMAEVLVTSTQIFLFVDGRYHEQADQEVDLNLVTVVKVPYGTGLTEALAQKIREEKYHLIGHELQRTPVAELKSWGSAFQWLGVDEQEYAAALGYADYPAREPIEEIPLRLAGRERLAKWSLMVQEKSALFLSTLDTLSWALNARAYHRPFQSSMKGLGLITRNKALVVIDPESPLAEGWDTVAEVEWVRASLHDQAALKGLFSAFLERERVDTVASFPNGLTVFFDELLTTLGKTRVDEEGSPWKWQAVKNAAELDAFRDSFKLASGVIAQSLGQVAKELQAGQELTEFDVRATLENTYTASGARGLSFRTIAGVGENGSIIHYGKSSKTRVIKPSELILVDSGAYYEAGFATDTTRTFLSRDEAQPWQIEIYTLVLKGLIALSRARFREGTEGGELDRLARSPIEAGGHHYAHGTGHGVGVLVHEGGYKIAPNSKVPMRANLVGSLEPGIYLPGRGGVRLENVAIVKQCTDDPQWLCFESLTWVGFDHRLIDRQALSSEECAWLDDYEQECQRRGTSFFSP